MPVLHLTPEFGLPSTVLMGVLSVLPLVYILFTVFMFLWTATIGASTNPAAVASSPAGEVTNPATEASDPAADAITPAAETSLADSEKTSRLTVVLNFAMVLLTGVLIAFYLIFLFNTQSIARERKSFWAMATLVGSVFVFPVFWYIYLWQPHTKLQ